ncbi:MAG: VOC family protein [Planctomycetota bacterium]
MSEAPRGGYRHLSPYLIVDDGDRALRLYAEAFGGAETMRLMGPDNAVMHAEIRLGDSVLMLAAATADMDVAKVRDDQWPTVSLVLPVEDCDAAYERAVAAGMHTEQPPTDMFYGERSAKLRDPFGHRWSLMSTVEALTPQEIQQRIDAMTAPEAS